MDRCRCDVRDQALLNAEDDGGGWEDGDLGSFQLENKQRRVRLRMLGRAGSSGLSSKGVTSPSSDCVPAPAAR